MAGTPPSAMILRDRRDEIARQRLLQRVSAEFLEMPCLHLTRPQAQRLFGLPADVCERILTTLQADGMLIRGSDDRYRLREGSNKLIRDV
jgi:hypothetical protein